MRSLKCYDERVAFGMLIGILAWALFPLGSNRPWSWSLLGLLVGFCWLLWCPSGWGRHRNAKASTRKLAGPLALIALAFGWGIIQILPWVPLNWVHPIWDLAEPILGRSTEATISLDPWRTETALLKLAAYIMIAWLTRTMAQSPDRANSLLNALIVIGGFYAAYALILGTVGFAQLELFYSTGGTSHNVSGPFVNYDNYATYSGIITLCAGIRLFERGSSSVTVARGLNPFVVSLVQYLFGRGVIYFLVTVLAFSSLIATGSRAGTFATLAAIAVVLILAGILAMRRGKWAWISAAGIIAPAGIATLFAINGEFLLTKLDYITVSGLNQDMRFRLWDAALRMVRDAPILGLGLGTYENAYPMYADDMAPFIVDRAHNDYLELAAGLGLPATGALVGAVLWLTIICFRGVLIRHRQRAYPMLTVGASILVAVHSVFDFSLQMPAIALTYAAIIGLGIAQASSTQSRQ